MANFYGLEVDNSGPFPEETVAPMALWREPIQSVIDIGANVGMLSMFAAEKRGAFVDSYEANPNVYQELITNINAHGLANKIHAQNLAVWGESDLSLMITNNGGCSQVKPEGHYAVKTVSFSDVLERGLSAPDYLKVDIEGAEWMFLDRNMIEWCADVQVLDLELHPDGYYLQDSKVSGCWGIDFAAKELDPMFFSEELIPILDRFLTRECGFIFACYLEGGPHGRHLIDGVRIGDWKRRIYYRPEGMKVGFKAQI